MITRRLTPSAALMGILSAIARLYREQSERFSGSEAVFLPSFAMALKTMRSELLRDLMVFAETFGEFMTFDAGTPIVLHDRAAAKLEYLLAGSDGKRFGAIFNEVSDAAAQTNVRVVLLGLLACNSAKPDEFLGVFPGIFSGPHVTPAGLGSFYARAAVVREGATEVRA